MRVRILSLTLIAVMLACTAAIVRIVIRLAGEHATGGLFLASLIFFGVIQHFLIVSLLSRTSVHDQSIDISSTDIWVCVDEEDIDIVRIALSSCVRVDGRGDVHCICVQVRSDIEALCEEFDVHYVVEVPEQTHDRPLLVVTASEVVYPDVLLQVSHVLSDSVGCVELDHAVSYEDHRAGAIVASTDVSLLSTIAQSTSTHGLLTYTGGPLFVRSWTRESVIGARTFTEIVSMLLRSRRGAITSVACCESIMKNESEHDVYMRIVRRKVMKKIPFRATLGSLRFVALRAFVWSTRLRVWAWGLVAGCVCVGVSTGTLFFHESELVGAFVVLSVIRYVYSLVHGDHRSIVMRIRDVIYECDAYGYRSYSRRAHMRIRIVPVFLCVLCVLLVVRIVLWIMNAPESSARGDAFSAVSVGVLFSLVVFIALKQFFISRQRESIRRNVTISGSADYESMWIIDLTPHGAAFISDTLHERGKLIPLAFRIPTETSDALITIEAKVSYSFTEGDQYKTGVSFKELSGGDADLLSVYCDILYPYRTARNEHGNMPDAPTVVRESIRRDKVTMCFYAVNVLAILGLMLVAIPHARAYSPEREKNHRRVENHVGDVTSDRLFSSSLPLIYEPSRGPDVSRFATSIELLNTPPQGYVSGDTAMVRVIVTNRGTHPASGYHVIARLGQDFDATTVVMHDTGGFSPCGVTGHDVTCSTLGPLGPAEQRSFTFSSLVRPGVTSSSARKLITTYVEEQQGNAIKESTTYAVIPVGASSSVGGEIFYDENANGIRDAGENGAVGLDISLVRFDDINGDGIKDLGEVSVRARDKTDTHGYYGTHKGNAAFQNLEPNKEYSVRISGVRGDEEISTPYDQTESLRDAGKIPLGTPWTALGEQNVQIVSALGVSPSAHDITVSLTSSDDSHLGVRTVELVSGVDANGNDIIESTEISASPVSVSATDANGVVTFSGVRDTFAPRLYALRFHVASGHGVQGGENDNSSAVTKFENIQSLSGNNYVIRDNSVEIEGKIFLDVNRDGEINGGENGIRGVVVSLANNGDSVHAVTDRSGGFKFSDVQPDSYEVHLVSIPADGVTARWGDSMEITLPADARSMLSPVALEQERSLSLERDQGEQHTFAENAVRGHFSDLSLTDTQRRGITIIWGLATIYALGSAVWALIRRKKLVVRA